MTGDHRQQLSETVAKQVLARAAQLDASDRMSVSIPDLRTAAVEAGISTSAVDQALREIAEPAALADVATDARQPPRPKSRRVLAVMAVVITLLGATVGFGLLRMVPRGEPEIPVPTMER